MIYIVIPAYNEEANLEQTVLAWQRIVNRLGKGSKLLVIDDGSQDGSWLLLHSLEEKCPDLVCLKQTNQGHGAACRAAYLYALQQKADYVFQADADNQIYPEEFWQFWHQRQDYDLVIGQRIARQDGLGRWLVSLALKVCLGLLGG
ncbi:MAG TPA: glycosyltransferase family 2 protein, partial [Candidatus Wirthbacteria bacterium]|nr:glycosyltransferase family 2 protein [Candidatus Wirthbacteria bacterium]